MTLKYKIDAILLGILCGALSYWFNPYNDMYVEGMNIYVILGIAVFVSALGLGLVYKKSNLLTPVLICLGVVIAAMARILDDTRIDPTDHNLFPFEILSLLMVAVPLAFFGWWLGNFINNKKPKAKN